MSPDPARWPGRVWRRLRALARRGPSRFVLRSYTSQFALLYMLLLAVSVAILLGFIDWSTAGYVARQTDATIAADINGLAEQYRLRGLTGLTTLIAGRVAADPTGATVYLLADDEAHPLVGNLNAWPDQAPDRDGWIEFRLRLPEPAAAGVRDLSARAQVFALRGGYRLLVGRDIRELTALRRLIREALAWGLLMTAALALLGGWLMSAGVVRRLEAVNQVSRRIVDGDLSRRVPTTGSGDDFDQLADNLNRMLARIEALMASVRQVSDNIAHDLRTPLTRLRQRLEAVPLDAPEIDAAIADADELLATFNALLRIARVESGSRRAGFAEVDLAALLADLADLYEPLAVEQRLELTVALPAHGETRTLHGDRDLLFQALANLVDNAIKYTPAGGRVRLALEQQGEGIVISVADTGPGIPAALRERVFERFFRVDDSRAAPGNGLGLSLVAAVVQLHGATMTLRERVPPPGLCARIEFAAAAPPDAATGRRRGCAD